MKTGMMSTEQVFSECLQVSSESFADVSLPSGNEEAVNFGSQDGGLTIFREIFAK